MGSSSLSRCGWRLLRIGLAALLFGAAIFAGNASINYSNEYKATEVSDGSKTLFVVRLIKFIETNGSAMGLAWSPDGKYIATSENWAKVIKIWDTGTWSLKHIVTARTGYSSSIQLFTQDGRFLITRSTELGYTRAALSIVDVASGEVVHQIEGPRDNTKFRLANAPQRVTLSPDGRLLCVEYLLSKGGDNIYIYDARTWQPVDHWKTGWLPQMIAGPKDGQVVMADNDGLVQTWDIAQRRVIGEFRATTRTLHSMALDNSGRYLATGIGSSGYVWDGAHQKLTLSYDAKGIRIWELSSGRELTAARSEPDVSAVAFSFDGRYLLADSSKLGRVHHSNDGMGNYVPYHIGYSIYRRADLKELHLVHDFNINRLDARFSPDGQYLALVGDDQIRIYAFEEAGSK